MSTAEDAQGGARAAVRGRLRWRCRRGMKELDLLLEGYLERRYARAAPAEQEAFERLLELADPDLIRLLLDQGVTEDTDLARLIQSIRDTADA